MNFFSWSVLRELQMCACIYIHTRMHTYRQHTYIRTSDPLYATDYRWVFISINAFLAIYRIRLLSPIFFVT